MVNEVTIEEVSGVIFATKEELKNCKQSLYALDTLLFNKLMEDMSDHGWNYAKFRREHPFFVGTATTVKGTNGKMYLEITQSLGVMDLEKKSYWLVVVKKEEDIWSQICLANGRIGQKRWIKPEMFDTWSKNVLNNTRTDLRWVEVERYGVTVRFTPATTN